MNEDFVKMEHGAGGELMQELINKVVLDKIELNSADGIGLCDLDDGASIPFGDEHLILTTDSHVVKPLFFPGGDIGRLAVSGTINDLSVMGAEPIALTNSLIIEEGMPLDKIKDIMASMNKTSKEAEVPIITGDTKVMDSEDLTGVVINTAGVGVAKEPIRDCGLEKGDKLLINGSIGDHGLSIMSFREGFTFESNLKSDVKPLNKLILECMKTGVIKAMKDPTRGGLANTLNEMASKSDMGILVDEVSLPINQGVQSLGEMLGIDPLEVANEGKVVMAVEEDSVSMVLEKMKDFSEERAEPAVIGEVIDKEKGRVVLETEVGGKRYIEEPIGDPVPRVC